MATHSSILAWRIPWTEEPGGLQPMGSQRVGHDLASKPPVPLTHRSLHALGSSHSEPWLGRADRAELRPEVDAVTQDSDCPIPSAFLLVSAPRPPSGYPARIPLAHLALNLFSGLLALPLRLGDPEQGIGPL